MRALDLGPGTAVFMDGPAGSPAIPRAVSCCPRAAAAPRPREPELLRENNLEDSITLTRAVFERTLNWKIRNSKLLFSLSLSPIHNCLEELVQQKRTACHDS